VLLEGLSSQLWPIHLKPYEDELLSSWMVRLARAYGVEPVKFWNRVSPDSINVRWPILDYLPPEKLLTVISRATATSPQRVLETTLLAVGSVQFIPRVNALLRYCPLCLAEDAEPYFRRKWRVDAFRICDCHNCLICCECHRCGRPQSLHKISLQAKSISCCSECGVDLRQEPPMVKVDVAMIQDWQRRLWGCAKETPPNLKKGSPWQLSLAKQTLQEYVRSRRRNSRG
jgi:hypothetical protein